MVEAIRYGYEGGLSEAMQETKYNLQQADISVSNKQNSKQQRPCSSCIDITFNKDNEVAFFSYITLQNFYTHMITVKQFVSPSSSQGIREDMKNEKNWKTVLKNH